MASSVASTSPHQIRTIEEAQMLIDDAHAQDIFCRRIKELSEIRAKEAIAEACLAYKKLLDAEMHTGEVFCVVEASGFQAQSLKSAQPPVVVQISGGADGSLRWIQGLITFDSTSLCVYPRGWDHGSHPGLSASAVLLYFTKTQLSFNSNDFVLALGLSILDISFFCMFPVVRTENCLFVNILGRSGSLNSIYLKARIKQAILFRSLNFLFQ